MLFILGRIEDRSYHVFHHLISGSNGSYDICDREVVKNISPVLTKSTFQSAKKYNYKIVNDLEHDTVSFYWVSYSGKKIIYFTLKPGQKKDHWRSYKGNRWTVDNDKGCIANLEVGFNKYQHTSGTFHVKDMVSFKKVSEEC